jgi:GNAT superfamily N-acetyltransferase
MVHDPRPTIERIDPTSPEAQVLIDELSELLGARYGSSGRDGFDPVEEGPGVFLVARVDDSPAGCGALRALAGHEGVAEVKRMYSRPGTRGVGRAVLAGLESAAREHGYASIWLETRRANNRAIRFYESAGYRERPAYGKYVGRPEAICMEKQLID